MSAKLVLFVLLALMMSIAAVLVAILPLFRKVISPEASKQEVNLQVLRDQLAELESDLQSGTLSQSQFDEAKQDIARRLLEDLPEPSLTQPVTQDQDVQKEAAQHAPSTPSGRFNRWLAISLSVCVPILSFVLYLSMGSPLAMQEENTGLGPESSAQSQGGPDNNDITIEKVQSLIPVLKAYIQKDPKDARAWATLARAYHYIGQFPEAAKAYKQAIPLNPQDADLKSEYEVVLKLAQQHPGPNAAAASGVSISGRVEIAPALAAQSHPDDIVYVFAKAENGPPMPLAVLRLKVKDLPANFKLDESMAMMPQLKLSLFPRVIVGARISKSGNPVPSSGDLQGQINGISPGSTGLVIHISERVP